MTKIEIIENKQSEECINTSHSGVIHFEEVNN